MSESRSGESRISVYKPIPVYTPSESRNGESRFESPNNKKNITTTIELTNVGKYNNLVDIDTLIEELESELPLKPTNSTKINQALEQRKKKIEQLKQLRNEIKTKEEEEKIFSEIQKSNAELDDIINNVKKLINKPNKNIQTSTYESRNGESRW